MSERVGEDARRFAVGPSLGNAVIAMTEAVALVEIASGDIGAHPLAKTLIEAPLAYVLMRSFERRDARRQQ